MSNTAPHDPLVIAGKTYRSRLLTGTGKFKDFEETRLATEAAGAEIVTVAIRRTNIGQDPNEPNLLDVLPPEKFTILPNTAGCYSADDAVRTLRLARELLDGHTLSSSRCSATRRTFSPTCPKRSRPPRPWCGTASTSWSTAPTTPSRRRCSRTSAAARSCRWPR